VLIHARAVGQFGRSMAIFGGGCNPRAKCGRKKNRGLRPGFG